MKHSVLVLLLAAGISCLETIPDGDPWYDGLYEATYPIAISQNITSLRIGIREELVVDFFLYTRENKGEPIVIRLDDEHSLRALNSSRPMKIIVHGWKNNHESPVGDILKEAYLRKLDANVIVVDWSSRSFQNYVGSRLSIPSVAESVANLVNKLVKKFRLSPCRVHMVGHSLGAHVAGVAGLKLPYKIARVTGLDPAAPMFTIDDDDIITPESADFVDIIHTCGYVLGFNSPLGHADFYPNTGTPAQPGCGLDIKGECSHSRAYELFAETIMTTDFLAVQCLDSTAFDQRNCSLPAIPMGEYAPSSARGMYFLKTRRSSPYAMGQPRM